MRPEKYRCEANAYDSSGFGHYYRCTKGAVVQRDGHWYCMVHDPEYIAQKQADREKKWENEWAEKDAQLERRKALAEIGKDFDTGFLEKNTRCIREFIETLKGES